MNFLADVRSRAARTPRRIAFPESADERTIAAVKELVRSRIVDPVLILDPARREAAEPPAGYWPTASKRVLRRNGRGSWSANR